MKKFELYKLPDTIKRVKLINTLNVEETVFTSVGFQNKLKKPMYLLVLDKIGNSHLIYLCNYEYGGGNFYIINTIQLQILDKKFIEKIKDYGNWRGQHIPFDIIERVKSSKTNINVCEREIQKLKGKIASEESQIAYYKRYSHLI